MPIQITPLDKFFKRLHVEASGVRKFTWLIGAGLSASSGIPLAREVSIRIILFEDFIESGEDCPWWSEDDLRRNESLGVARYSRIGYSESELETFLDWVELIEKDKEELDKYLSPAIDRLKKNPIFKDITVDEPECYQLCFEHLFQDDTTGVTFLNHLIRRAKGVNLAHLALAGILRDHPEWGNTVFTTNFDDLLLKALLQLNYNARIFGEFDTIAEPEIDPNYPQIVYLHGKHTGYNLLNKDDEISLINPVLQRSFKSHIRNTNLIVIGYSGWDDLVMKTLKEWKEDPHLIRGNLYWIPLEDESQILPNVWEFLNQLPKNKVRIIVDETKLNADKFMLALCDYFNRQKGGFTPYRKEIIKNAEKQHGFLIQQLTDHPDYHPARALKLIDNLKEKISQNRERALVIKGLKEIITISQNDDIPPMLLAEILKGIGVVHMFLRDYQTAINYLERAVEIFAMESLHREEAKEKRMNTHLLLAEAGHEIQDANKMEKHCRIYLSEARRFDIHKPNELCRIYLIFSILTLSKSYQKPLLHIAYGKDNAKKLEDSELWIAEFEFIEALYEMIEKNEFKALRIFEKIKGIYKRYNIKNRLANICIHIASVKAIEKKFEESKQLLENAIAQFSDIGDQLGVANTNAMYGDILFQQSQLENAIVQYQKAIKLYEQIGCDYNQINTLIDLAHIYKKEKKDDNLVEVRDQLKVLNGKKETKNPYYEYNFRKGTFQVNEKNNDERQTDKEEEVR